MVVCKCRKATKLYCFVHNVPVCGECICFPEHQICVVKMYSEWVIDAEYDWPPKCPSCHKILQEGGDSVARLGCLHVLHNSCLVSHLQNFPPQTTPAGYICPSCSIPVWPQKSIRDLNSTFSSRLKDIIAQSGLSETLLGRDATSLQHSAQLVPASLSASSGMNNSDFASIAPRIETSISSALNLGDSSSNRVNGSSSASSLQTAIDIDGYTANSNGAASRSPYSKMANPPLTPGATTRIKSSRGGKLGNNEDDYDDNADVNDDDDGARRKYNRRGPFYRHFLRFLLPFWRTSLPTLPVTAPPVRKDDRESLGAEDIIEGRSRRRKRSSSVDPMKVILFFAIMSCMATILMLYYRLAQGGTKEEHSLVEGQ